MKLVPTCADAVSKELYTPWEDHNGDPLPIPILKERSKLWSKEIWERYLESIEPSPRELPFGKPGHELLTEEEREGTEISEKLASYLRALIESLPSSERAVVVGIFWEGQTQRQLAQSLGVSRTTVQSYLTRARQRLRQHLPSKFPIVEGHEPPASESCARPRRAIIQRKGN